MDFVLVIFVFFFGLACGSFLNVLAWRLPRDETVVRHRSYCLACKSILRWFELIPLVSFFWQGGKCRSCQNQISWQYPIVELITGLTFVFVSYVVMGSLLHDISLFSPFFFGSPEVAGGIDGQFPAFKIIELFYLWFVVSVLITVFVTDLRYYIIPDKIIFPAIGITLFYNFFSSPEDSVFDIWSSDVSSFVSNPFWGGLGSGVLVAGFFLSFVLASRGRWMGMGDVKYALWMGLVLGFPEIFVALFLSFFSGSLVGLGLVLLRKKAMTSLLPFGVFLTISTFIALFFGEFLFNWYWNTLL